MSYIHKLSSHIDIGYNNFFNSFRDEYHRTMIDVSQEERILYINGKLEKFNCVLEVNSLKDVNLIFKTEQDFTWFVLLWIG